MGLKVSVSKESDGGKKMSENTNVLGRQRQRRILAVVKYSLTTQVLMREKDGNVPLAVSRK